MSKAVTLERKQIRFLLKDFYQLRKALNLLRKSKPENKEEHKKRIHALAKELRSKFTGLFFGEFRTEYKLYRNFTKLQKELKILLAVIEDKAQQQKIVSLLAKAGVYNAKLTELGSRGGVIEKILLRLSDEEDTLADERELDQKLDEAIQASNAFEVVVQSLVKETQAVEKIRKEVALVPKNPSERENIFFYKDMAVSVYGGTFILYDAVRFREAIKHAVEMSVDQEQFVLSREQEETISAFNEFTGAIKEKGYPQGSGMFSDSPPLTYHQFVVLRTSIIGYCEFKDHKDRADYLGAHEIYRIAARKGFGTFFLELILSYASLDHRPVVIDRKEVSPEARQFWHGFDVKRKDILKYPAALSKYPEEGGWTSENVVETFGGSFGSTFDGQGKPGRIFDKRPRWVSSIVGSYLKRKGKPDTNLILDPLASLDKAFFYDGKVKEVTILMERSDKILSSLGQTIPRFREFESFQKNKIYGEGVLFNAGYAFFMSFKDTASNERLNKHKSEIKREVDKKKITKFRKQEKRLLKEQEKRK